MKGEYQLKKTKKDIIEDQNREAIKIYCKCCGHTNTIPAFVDSKICRWCGNKIINTTKAHFIRTMMQKMKGNNNEE